MSRLAAARARFAAAHEEDPRGLAAGYHARLLRWLLEVAPEPSEPLLLAAACQHLRRWRIPRASYPDGLAGYKRWRSELARLHAVEAEQVLREVGYDDAPVARVRALLLKKGLGADVEVGLFEDAICLVFLEGELEAFAAKHPPEKVRAVLDRTLAKMTPAGRERAARLPAYRAWATPRP